MLSRLHCASLSDIRVVGIEKNILLLGRNFGTIFPVPYPILSYITLITAIRCQKMRFKSHRGEE